MLKNLDIIGDVGLCDGENVKRIIEKLQEMGLFQPFFNNTFTICTSKYLSPRVLFYTLSYLSPFQTKVQIIHDEDEG